MTVTVMRPVSLLEIAALTTLSFVPVGYSFKRFEWDIQHETVPWISGLPGVSVGQTMVDVDWENRREKDE